LAGRSWGHNSHTMKSFHQTLTQSAGTYAIGAWESFTSKPNLNKLEVRKNEDQLRTGTSPLVRSCWARYAETPDNERMCPNDCDTIEDVEHLFWGCTCFGDAKCTQRSAWDTL